MNRFVLCTSLLLSLPLPAAAATRPPMPGTGDDPVRVSAVEPPVMVVGPGDRAPDFAFEAGDGTALRLHDVLEHGHVLLVFQPDPDQLVELEKERADLEHRSVFVIAVLDRGERASRTLVRRLGLHFAVIPDVRAVIAGQFNVLGANTRRPDPAWFAIDRSGKIRALERGRVPDTDYVSFATSALHLPSPDAIAPSSH